MSFWVPTDSAVLSPLQKRDHGPPENSSLHHKKNQDHQTGDAGSNRTGRFRNHSLQARNRFSPSGEAESPEGSGKWKKSKNLGSPTTKQDYHDRAVVIGKGWGRGARTSMASCKELGN